jgi:hypothetical protein
VPPTAATSIYLKAKGEAHYNCGRRATNATVGGGKGVLIGKYTGPL